ncbi:hypothetical protein E3P99_03630 [Wallemia hederae]|uniref:Mitochondrial import receptor subunit TOM40 n=1 Tax=Wallemia hederae TaxID=1540922 RepID=A0A4V4LSR4_9BASI|nr:hypothetical protein E3P99_03630 [Wallemia hederae]
MSNANFQQVAPGEAAPVLNQSEVSAQLHPSQPPAQTALSPITNTYSRFMDWRRSLNLGNPGTAEAMGREAKTTLLTNFIFDGARADLTKGISLNPAFQVTHSFALGSQQAPPNYSFGAVYADAKSFLQGAVDHTGTLTGRANQSFAGLGTGKLQAQLSEVPGQSMIQLEHDYQGLDYSINGKAMNPSLIDGTGIYIGSYLQSLTPNIALGFETLLQRPQPGISESLTSYLVRLSGTNKDWLATAQINPSGMLEATYHHKLSDKVDAAATLQVINRPQGKEANASLGAKYDFRMASFRGQLDSTGKVSALLEQRFTPAFAFLVAGEIDHLKNASKFGVGIMLESTTMTPEEMNAAMQSVPQPPI